MRLTPISRRDFIRRMQNLGWDGPLSGGKHEFMVRGAMKLPIPNPHGSGEISVGKLREILNEIGVSRDEWQRAS
jgi:predicted RNA binding protein YcfA (HicA-like mRNA interferase family)